MDGLYSLTSMSLDITSCYHIGWLLALESWQRAIIGLLEENCCNHSLEHHCMFHNWRIVTLINNYSAATETTMEPHALVSIL
jgi:hypothetical protein